MSEHSEQCALFNWSRTFEQKFPELSLMFAVPNGGKRPIKTAVDLKLEGVKSGVPDVWVPVPSGERCGMVFEMKSGRNKCTTDQNKWLDDLSAAGWYTGSRAYYDWIEAAIDVCKYLGINPKDAGLYDRI